MGWTCEITGKRKLRGNRVSHANNRTPHFQEPNLHKKEFFIPELGSNVKLRVCRRAIRTLDKFGGLSNYLRKTDGEKLIPKLLKLKKTLAKRPPVKATIL